MQPLCFGKEGVGIKVVTRLLASRCGALLAGLTLLAAAFPGLSQAQGEAITMSVEPSSQTVDIGDGVFTVDVEVEGAVRLTSFEFTLRYDPSIVRFVGVEEGPFLGSTGRAVSCHRKFPHTRDRIQFGCVTSGSERAETAPPGASGSGLLATVALAPRKSGTSTLALDDPKATYEVLEWPNPEPAQDVPVSTQGGSVTVTGSLPTATPAPDEPTPVPTEFVPTPTTPTAIPSYWTLGTPGPAAPFSSPITGQGGDTTGVSGDSAAGSTAGGAGTSGEPSGAGGDFPGAGTGPPEEQGEPWAAAAGWALATAGAGLLLASVLLRNRIPRRSKR